MSLPHFPLFYVQIPKPILLFLLSLKVWIEEKEAKTHFSGKLSYLLPEGKRNSDVPERRNETKTPFQGIKDWLRRLR